MIRTNFICTVEGCEKPAKCRTLCGTHYTRLQRHGSPLAVKEIHGDDEARFWSKVNRNGPPPPSGTPAAARGLGCCWTWTGSFGSSKYGIFPRKGRPKTTAHRIAYEAVVGTIPNGLEPDHLCEMNWCVNPEHLEMVTHQENCRRREIAKKRKATA